MMKIKEVNQIIEQTVEKRNSNFILVDSDDKLPKYAAQANPQWKYVCMVIRFCCLSTVSLKSV